jgi:hypothetical protein
LRAELLDLQSHIPDFHFPAVSTKECRQWLAKFSVVVCDLPGLEDRVQRAARLLRTQKGHDAGVAEIVRLLEEAITFCEVHASTELNDAGVLRGRWEVMSYGCPVWWELPDRYLPGEIWELRLEKGWAAARPIEESQAK